MADIEHLTELGLSDKQITLYLALLELGQSKASDLAKRTGFKRPSVYDMLNNLVQRGLITCTMQGKRQFFQAEHPRVLLEIPKRIDQHVRKVLPELQQIYNRNTQKPTFRYYEGVEGIRRITEDLLECKTNEYWYVSDATELSKILGISYLEDFVKRRIEKGLWANAIRIRRSEVDMNILQPGPDNKRRLRFLPHAPLEDIASLHLYDNKVCFISSSKECFAMLIESKEVFTLMKFMWSTLWGVADEP